MLELRFWLAFWLLQEVQENNACFVWSTDTLLPFVSFIVIKACIPHLGAEIHFIEDYMERRLHNGEIDYLLTTVRVSISQKRQRITLHKKKKFYVYGRSLCGSYGTQKRSKWHSFVPQNRQRIGTTPNDLFVNLKNLSFDGLKAFLYVGEQLWG